MIHILFYDIFLLSSHSTNFKNNLELHPPRTDIDTIQIMTISLPYGRLLLIERKSSQSLSEFMTKNVSNLI